jgi:hypothetical protein
MVFDERGFTTRPADGGLVWGWNSWGTTPAGQVKSRQLRPVVNRTGAGARGQGMIVGSDGSVMLTLLGVRKIQDLVRLEP